MTNEQAWLYAANWGSFMTNGDPGACMYGFDESFTLQSEDHRAQCLAYIDNECIPAVTASPGEYEPNELAKLAELRAKIAGPAPDADPDVEEFFDGMMNAALWSSTDYDSADDGASFMDNGATLADVAPVTLAKLREDALTFVTAHRAVIVEANFAGRADGSIMSRAGHDFWLTRCGHGAGFWDGDWADEADAVLTKASKEFGEVDLYRDDDGLIYA